MGRIMMIVLAILLVPSLAQADLAYKGYRPLQGTSFSVEVGHFEATGLSKSEAIDELEEGFSDWTDELTDGDITFSLVDGGDVAHGQTRDGVNSIVTLYDDTDTFLARSFHWRYSYQSWRLEEFDHVYQEWCTCWGACDFYCQDGNGYDITTICLHEVGHPLGLQDCDYCGLENTVMNRPAPPDCGTGGLGNWDIDFANVVYEGLSSDANEPDNDMWDGAMDMGVLENNIGWNDLYDENNRMQGIMDVDIFQFDVVGNWNPENWLVGVWLTPPSDSDMAMQFIFNGGEIGVVDSGGEGTTEYIEYPAWTGEYDIRVWESDHVGSDSNYALWVYIYQPHSSVDLMDQDVKPITVRYGSQPEVTIKTDDIGFLSFYDVTGRQLERLPIRPGETTVTPRILNSGVYYARLTTSTSTDIANMVVVR